MPESFTTWLERSFGITPTAAHDLRIDAAFEIFLSRLESAHARGARDPLVTITGKAAGGNSRIVTRRMLEQLGYTPAQRRAAHRLLAGSSSGWPGLLRMYAGQQPLTPAHRRYVRRQLFILRRVVLADVSERAQGMHP